MSETASRNARAVRLFLVFILIWLFGPGLARHMERDADRFVFNDDSCQHVVPYLRFWDRELMQADYASEYFFASHPIGYRALYMVGARFCDPRTLSKVLPYVLFAVLLALLAMAARKIGGFAAAWSVVAIALSGDVFMERMIGGCPRTFGYPLLAAMLLALLSGRVRWMLALCVIAALFYPPAAAWCGFTLAFLLFVMPSRYRGDAQNWTFPRRLGALALTGGLMVLLFIPVMVSMRPYGPAFSKERNIEYPEASHYGMHLSTECPDYHPPFFRAALSFGKKLFHVEDEFFAFQDSLQENAATAMVIAVAVGVILSARYGGAAPRLIGAAIVTACAYQVAMLASPRLFLPSRYLAYPVPLLVLLGWPVAVDAACRLVDRLSGRHCSRAWSMIALTTGLLVLAGGRLRDDLATLKCDTETRALCANIERLPKSALIAGWPRAMNVVPYVTGRRVFVSKVTHMTMHRTFTDEMRGRMRALLDAYFARDPAPLIELRERYGVTHFVVKRKNLERPPPVYFKPFDAWIQKTRGDSPASDLELTRQMDKAAIWNDGSLYLLDLSRI